MAKINAKEFIESLKEMTILEIKELIDAMKEEFGIDPSAVAAAPAAAAAEVVDEGPKEVDVMLTEVGASKVKVIKVIREVTGLGLIDAKKLVDSAPIAVKEKVAEDAGKELQEKLEAAGAKVELK
ncbi:50S ribosomal protein L7/L12 [Candidatus Izemoplasma sp. B36]|uniref:50S ribosomal protein L7/L12 n=1 Tax=Candidatus Izemoplasma sp. B36 TaxID=3242468 RepID=UPI00355742BF